MQKLFCLMTLLKRLKIASVVSVLIVRALLITKHRSICINQKFILHKKWYTFIYNMNHKNEEFLEEIVM